MIDFLQWAGCITGVAGASLLALNTKNSGWGFVLFLVSNGFWTAFGIQTNAPGLGKKKLDGEIVNQLAHQVCDGRAVLRAVDFQFLVPIDWHLHIHAHHPRLVFLRTSSARLFLGSWCF